MGGKSRKTGGISKKLIDRIKRGDSLNNKKAPCTKQKKELFNFDEPIKKPSK